MNIEAVKHIANKTIALEAAAIAALTNYINDDFLQAVELIQSCTGRLIISGIGKSGLVAQKIVSTLNSTGTPSYFLHAADAIHGDLGIIQPGDIVMLISKSGESPEIKVLIPLIKNYGNTIIAMSGNENGFLAKNSNIFINTFVEKEACLNNLAPTTSTTAQMVMGDALALALMSINGFSEEDFGRVHPGGNLGKRLFLRVSDIYDKTNLPKVDINASLKEVIVEITAKRLGAVGVVNAEEQLVGIITDGDLRRMLASINDLTDVHAKDIYNKNPKTINSTELAITALELMRLHDVSQLLVIENERYSGVLHLHDLVKEGII